MHRWPADHAHLIPPWPAWPTMASGYSAAERPCLLVLAWSRVCVARVRRQPWPLPPAGGGGTAAEGAVRSGRSTAVVPNSRPAADDAPRRRPCEYPHPLQYPHQLPRYCCSVSSADARRRFGLHRVQEVAAGMPGRKHGPLRRLTLVAAMQGAVKQTYRGHKRWLVCSPAAVRGGARRGSAGRRPRWRLHHVLAGIHAQWCCGLPTL